MNQAAGIVFAAAQAGLRPTHHFSAGRIDLVEFARGAVRTENILLAAGIGARDAQAPGRAFAGNGFFEVQIVVIDLDAMIVAVGGIDIILGVHRDAVDDIELVGAGTVGAHCFQPMAARRDLDEA